jgi:hypothetical protein
MFLGLCEASDQQPEMGEEEPSDFGCGGTFEVLGEAAASSEPGEGALDNPAPRQKLEALDPLRSLDDFDRPRSAMGQRIDELIAAVNPVGEDMAQPREPASQPLQQWDRSMAVLNVGGMNVDGEQKAVGVGDDVPLAAVDAFAGIEASRTAGLGCWRTLTVDDGGRRPWLRPSSRRARRTRAATILCHQPMSRQA